MSHLQHCHFDFCGKTEGQKGFISVWTLVMDIFISVFRALFHKGLQPLYCGGSESVGVGLLSHTHEPVSC